MSDSSFDKEAFQAAIGPVIASLGLAALTGALTSAIKKLTATNVKKSTAAGDTEMRPSKAEENLAEQKAKGTATDSSLAKDNVELERGKVTAAEQTADASTSEATASEAGASASRVKSGASDVETKAMKVM